MAERTEELQKKSPVLPSAAQVIAYLRRHPDFLYRHPELLDIQTPPARHNEGAVVDLQHFMVERLRNDVAKLRANQDEIIANSRDNLGTQERIHKAVLALLEAETFEEFIEIITGDLVLLLEVDVVCLCIERTEGYNRRPKLDGLELLEQGAVDRIMSEASNYYVISVADPPVRRSADLRELDVRVKRDGVTVRARRAIPGRQ